MYADVLILKAESNYDQILTYLAPEERKGCIAPGHLVLVPLRKRLVKGLVLELHEGKDHTEKIKRLKTIQGILDSRVALSGESLRIAFWLSRYYVCSLNKTVHLFLPPPVRQEGKEILKLSGLIQKERLFLTEKESRIIGYLKNKRKQEAPLREILKVFGPEAQAETEFLLTSGYLTKTQVFSPSVGENSLKTAALKKEAPSALELSAKAPLQAKVIKILEQGPQPLSALRKALPNSATALSALRRKGWIDIYEVKVNRDPSAIKMSVRQPERLNDDQLAACRKIKESLSRMKGEKWLLFGVTGSGKTEVFLQAIEEALALGKQVLYLVPEIALTPQVTARLAGAFGSKVAILHSALTPGERYDEWMRIKEGRARIVLGPRSAVFAPFSDLGLIVIDEEHESAYKQSEPDPRYDARRVAVELAASYGAVIVFGSATPSLATYRKALSGEYGLITLPSRVVARPLPEIIVIDMKKEQKDCGGRLFSRQLLDSMQNVIKKGEQAIIFLNRRGFHTYVFCQQCGQALNCPHCAIALTYHLHSSSLVCHYCNFRRTLPRQCAFCGSSFLHYAGTGTERIVSELNRLLPEARLLRMDADTTRRKGSHTLILKKFQEGEADILVGTQMIAKGLDFPKVTLVGIINTDALLNMPDYQATERSYQLVSQVAGRAGRGEKKGKVFVQTFHPENSLFSVVRDQDYDSFYRQETANRKIMNYPPYTSVVRILVSGQQEKKVSERVDYLSKLLKIEIGKKNWDIDIMGPCPAPLSCLKGRYRHHFILRGAELEPLQELAHLVRDTAGSDEADTRTVIDVEPQTLL